MSLDIKRPSRTEKHEKICKPLLNSGLLECYEIYRDFKREDLGFEYLLGGLF